VTVATRADTVRELVDAFNAGDLTDDVIQSLFDPGVELCDFPDAPGHRRYVGHDGLRQFLAEFAENWKVAELQLSEIRELGDKVVILGRQRSVGALTDVPVETDFGEVLEFQGDRIFRIRMFRSRAEALEAADA
jgi:ketosteroid isomerase-like protein